MIAVVINNTLERSIEILETGDFVQPYLCSISALHNSWLNSRGAKLQNYDENVKMLVSLWAFNLSIKHFLFSNYLSSGLLQVNRGTVGRAKRG